VFEINTAISNTYENATSCRDQRHKPDRLGFRPVLALVYARHGRELMGCKSPVLESSHCREDRVNQVLAEGKGVSARRGLEEA
jgi:hypothetical protein